MVQEHLGGIVKKVKETGEGAGDIGVVGEEGLQEERRKRRPGRRRRRLGQGEEKDEVEEGWSAVNSGGRR